MIDSHCHLDHEPLFEDLENIIKRSKEIGLEKILTICTTLDSFTNILKIIEKDPMIYGTFGIHPHEAKDNIVDTDQIIYHVKQSNKIIGIGR